MTKTIQAAGFTAKILEALAERPLSRRELTAKIGCSDLTTVQLTQKLEKLGLVAKKPGPFILGKKGIPPFVYSLT